MIETVTFDGAPLGTNVAAPAHAIDDMEAVFIQDFWVDKPGILYGRGGFATGTLLTSSTDRYVAVFSTTLQDGTQKVAGIRYSGGSSVFQLVALNAALTTATVINTLCGGDTFTAGDAARAIIDIKPLLGGGVAIGISKSYTEATQYLAYWKGASAPILSTTLVTSTLGSRTVTTASAASWLTTVEPGMFLNSPADHIGTVRSVESNTSLTLEAPAPVTASAVTFSISPTRGYVPRYSGGLIKTVSGSTAVVGSNTRWKEEQVGSNTSIFRRTDGAYVGAVNVVNSNTSITLTANAAQVLDGEGYFMLSRQGMYDDLLKWEANGYRPGFLNAMYTGRQWYANRLGRKTVNTIGQEDSHVSRIWFSHPEHPEEVDFSEQAGNWFTVGDPRQPIMALVPTYNSLLIIKENEVYAIMGDNPDNYHPVYLGSDGTVCGMSAQIVADGAIWVGRQGVFKYNGSGIENISDKKLGSAFVNSMTNFDVKNSRIFSTVYGDYYFFNITAFTSVPEFSATRGASTTSYTSGTWAIYLPTMAYTFVTNLNFIAGNYIPGNTPISHALTVLNSAGGSRFVNTSDLWSRTTAADGVATTNWSIGPSPYIEAKRYDVGDAMRKKLFKQLAMAYLSPNTALTLDTIVGLNPTGTTSLSTFPVSATYVVKRIKFLKRTQHLGFRLYAPTGTAGVSIGPWHIGFKLQRPGRV